jgi:hypothetical protein
MKNLDQILTQRRDEMLGNPSLKARYESMLLKAFPLEMNGGNFFHKNTFTGEDEKDYLSSIAIFEGKKWNEVDFEIIYSKYIQFLMLSSEGKLYYLPTFLKNFYDLRFTNIEYFTYFLGDLENGFFVPGIDELEKASDDRSYKKTQDLSSFEKINPIQSKLVAMFLVNVANLLPDDSQDAMQAQRALTNYWGNFLLF